MSSIGAFIAGFGVLVFLATMIEAFLAKRKAGDNPWGVGRHDAGMDAVRRRRRSTPITNCRGSPESLADMATAETFTDGSRAATVGDFFALLKPRVMSLVIFTGLAGIVVAPGTISPITAFTALLCIAVGAGASGALNMAYDSDIDGLMSRTATRPIPMGMIARGDALGFGWTLRVGSVTLMGLFVNFLAAGAARVHDPLLCRRLHALAEAPHDAEHRHRRSCRRVAAGDRLGGGDGQSFARAAGARAHHVPLDAAAFLGARALSLRRLCARWRAHDAGGEGQGVDAPADSALCARAVPGRDCCRARSALAGPLYLGGRVDLRRLVRLGRRSRLRARPMSSASLRHVVCSASQSFICSCCLRH